MKTQILLSFAFLLICSLSFAQIAEIPKSYQIKITQYREELKTQPEAAQKKLLILIDEAKKKGLHLVSIRAYEVFAYRYATIGDGQNALKYAKAAVELAEQHDYPAEAAVMYGVIGQQYGRMGMDDDAKEYLQKGIDLIRKPKNDDEKHHLGNLYTYRIYTKETGKDSTQTYLKYAKQALATYLTIENKELRKKTSALGYGNVGMLYGEMKQYDSAFIALNKLLTLNKGKNAYLSGGSYLQKGMLFLEMKKLDSAEINLKKSEEILLGKGFINEEKELYSQFIKLYELKGDKNKLKEYKSAYLELENRQQKSRLGTATELLKNENNEKKTVISNFYKVAVGLGIVIISLLIVLGIQRIKYRREKAAFDAFRNNRISDEKYSAGNHLTENNPEIKAIPEEIQKNDALNEETEIRLLQGLEKFEKEHGYNEKGIALGKIASQLNTNTKYLSIVIKNHKADNFSNYINTLRINYIIDKIENAPEYRKYKLSYLAEETGFSSANAFSKVFKDFTGVSPSSYISLIGEEQSIN
ncbi:helix-turn-helix domain-containing protein [Chryseobacterium sp.]|jgi:YesN/AraC family two-component response regulator|uniref:helix-turn-helix domain-containing protein n=1 Tax=Chryseobacterium sp. TaxID=1871047 RepID=UPI002611F93C|nr:helix-turn-helix domain-containing protein [Chryseobacterium sp.]